MAGQEQEQDRSEEATPHKRQEARKKGTVSRSLDLFALTSMAVFLLFALLWGKTVVQRMLNTFAATFSAVGKISFTINDFFIWSSSLGKELVYLLLPLWLLGIGAAVLIGMLQVGIVISFQPLKPDWKRLNPVQGFKKLLNLRILFETVKSTLKLIVFSAVLYFFLQNALPGWLAMLYSSIGGIVVITGENTLRFIQYSLLIMLVFAGADWLFVKRSVNKKLRMSKREVKEEYKRREGDPRIKAKLKEIRQQLLQKVKGLTAIKEADVVIVNPQHLALAIQYKKEQMAVPIVVAKGAGEMALSIRKIALRYHVPILEHKILARSLYHSVDINSGIPELYYRDVAKALVWAFKQKAIKR